MRIIELFAQKTFVVLMVVVDGSASASLNHMENGVISIRKMLSKSLLGVFQIIAFVPIKRSKPCTVFPPKLSLHQICYYRPKLLARKNGVRFLRVTEVLDAKLDVSMVTRVIFGERSSP